MGFEHLRSINILALTFCTPVQFRLTCLLILNAHSKKKVKWIYFIKNISCLKLILILYYLKCLKYDILLVFAFGIPQSFKGGIGFY